MIDEPARPTEVGQKVRALSYGGAVRQYHRYGTVVRFTRAGNPVIWALGYGHAHDREVTDTYGCFRVVDSENRWVRSKAPTSD